MIYTTNFASLRRLPSDIIPISISAKAPEWYKGIQYKKLAPKYDFFMKWKQNHDNQFYIEHFQKEVLDTLFVHHTHLELNKLAEDLEYPVVHGNELMSKIIELYN